MSRQVVLRWRRPELSLRLPARAFTLVGALILLVAVAICLTTAFGEYAIPVPDVVRTVFGHGSRVDTVVVDEFRLPRVMAAVLIGATLGLSGGIFQLLTRNPLAAPDVTGVNEGAAAVAVFLLLFGAPAALIPVGAFVGAVLALAAVAALGVRRGLSMYRLILVGIGINTLAGAVIAYLLTRPSPTDFERLQVAQQWLVGSVSGTTWQDVRVLAIVLAVGTPLVLACGRQLNAWQLGADLGAALGVPVVRLQLVTAGLGAMLAAFAVSVAGPIGFVAFVSPHIARRLARADGVGALPVAMGVGALLTLSADYLAQRALAPDDLPVGVTTTVLGAPYLLYLLIRGAHRTGFG